MVIHIKVISKSSVNKVGYDEDANFYRVKVTDSSVSGKANKKVIELITDYLNISKSKVKIKFGYKNKVKLVEIIDG